MTYTTVTETAVSAATSTTRQNEAALRTPEQSPRERMLVLLLFLVSFAYLLLFRRYTAMEPDEGIILQGAQRILRGEVLYRDFFAFLTPGSYYFTAWIFKSFGSSMIVARTTLVFFGAVFTLITYLLARRVCSRRTSLLAAGIATLTTLPYRFLALHNWDSTLLACLAIYCAVRLMESTRTGWALALGSLISLTFLFEQSKGTGLGLGLIAGLLAARGNRRHLFRSSLVFALAIGLAWPIIVTLAYFGAQHTLPVMFADWFWPLQHYSLANHVPYGYQNWSENTRHNFFNTGSIGIRFVTALALSPCLLIPVLPIIGIAISIHWLIRRRHAPEAKYNYYVLTGAAVMGLLASVVVGRADIIHFMYLQPVFCVVLAWLLDGEDIPGRTYRRAKPFFATYVAIAFFLFSVALLIRTVNARSAVATRRGNITVPAKDTVIEYVQAHVAPGESTLVYPYLPLYYYLTDTFSATRFEYFQAGMNTREQANETLADLHSKRVRVVLFEPGFVQKIPDSWPGTPLAAIAQDPIADYILTAYRSCKILRSPNDWRFLFMVRKDLPCP
jgi:4-amino-4-deoxy-L-arabinose transferase-like glycosyltransferase